MLGAPRDLDHGGRHFARRRGQLLAHRRQVARGPRDLVRRPHHVSDDSAQALAHEAHGIRQHLELLRHVARRYRAQVPAAEAFRGRHEAHEGALDPAQRERADDHADHGRREQHKPEDDLPATGFVAEAPPRQTRLLRLTGRQFAYEAAQVGGRPSDLRGLREGLAAPSHVEQRVRDRVVDMDRRLQLLDLGYGDTIVLRQPLEPVELLLIAEGAVRRRLELIARLAARRGQVQLRRAYLLEHRGDEPVADLTRGTEALDFRFERAPQRGQRADAYDGRDDEPHEQSRQPQDDPPPDRVERRQLHCAASVTMRPPRTTPTTTDFAGTSPRPSKAIVPVTPSYAGRSVPIRAR